MKARFCSLLLAVLLGSASSAFSQLIVPASVTGTGFYGGNVNRIIDGVVPAESTPFIWTNTVYWVGLSTSFTVDLGATYRINDILTSVDNNDRYVVESSLDGLSFTNVFTIISSFGEIGWGMDTMTSDETSPEYVDFNFNDPVDARFLRIRATGGDGFNAVGELQAFGSAVPEPSTYGMFAAAALLGLAAWRRRSAAAK